MIYKERRDDVLPHHPWLRHGLRRRVGDHVSDGVDDMVSECDRVLA